MREWSAICLRQRRSLYTPDASKCGRAHARFLRALSGTLGAIRRLEGPHGCWIDRVSHRYTAFVMTGAPSGGPCPHQYTDRHTPRQASNTDRYTTGIRAWRPECAVGAGFRPSRHARTAPEIGLRRVEFACAGALRLRQRCPRRACRTVIRPRARPLDCSAMPQSRSTSPPCFEDFTVRRYERRHRRRAPVPSAPVGGRPDNAYREDMTCPSHR